MEDFEQMENREDVFSRAVKAGKRTYFFDVKQTRADQYYLTITESKRRFDNAQGNSSMRSTSFSYIGKISKSSGMGSAMLFHLSRQVLFLRARIPRNQECACGCDFDDLDKS
jgi:hypothetical protein